MQEMKRLGLIYDMEIVWGCNMYRAEWLDFVKGRVGLGETLN